MKFATLNHIHYLLVQDVKNSEKMMERDREPYKASDYEDEDAKAVFTASRNRYEAAREALEDFNNQEF